MARRLRGRRDDMRARIGSLIAAMETPLHRACGMADALAFVGYGLESMEYDGALPVLTISTSLMDDLAALQKGWAAIAAALDAS
ncbi:MAG TPA: hypothetical protein VGG48_08405 [Rhizomicrobium sp.]|jgi:hypothetical protein